MEQQPLYYDTPPAPKKPMKWHNFLIYFALWLAALVMIFNAYRFFTGKIEGSAADVRYIYSLWPELKGIHTVMGILCTGAAVLALITRFALAGFKRNAIALLSAVYLCNALVNPLYTLMIKLFTSVPTDGMFSASLFSGVAVPIAMIFINRDYYAKRADLFVK